MILHAPSNPTPCFPSTPVYLLGEPVLFSCGGEYPSALVPGLLVTAPVLANSPTLSHPTDQVTIST